MPERQQFALFPDSLFPHPTESTRLKPSAQPTPALELLNKKPATVPKGCQWLTITLNGYTVDYLLRRSKRRTLGLHVNDSGLLITAPSWVSLSQVESTLEKKADWILDKLTQRHERQKKLALHQIHWRNGDRIPYLGRSIILELNPVLPQAIFTGENSSPKDGDRLLLPLRADADSTQMRELTESWLQQQARLYFQQRLDIYLAKGRLTMARLRLAAPTKRWGSCTSDGTIMLNWRLIHLPLDIIDYVVAHEVAHLKEMNHSRAFWDFVEFLMPGFHLARAQLRQHEPGTLPLL